MRKLAGRRRCAGATRASQASKAARRAGSAQLIEVAPLGFAGAGPPLGKDLIAMLKDSSFVSVLGVQDITRLGKVYSASTFRFFETYNVVAYLYLVMTIGLSLFVRYLEKRTPVAGHDGSGQRLR